MATNANTAGATEGSMVKRLDAILEVLQNLLIIEGHEAGVKKAKVRAIVKVADARVSKVWRELDAAGRPKIRRRPRMSRQHEAQSVPRRALARANRLG